jgi:hypothetical protein
MSELAEFMNCFDQFVERKLFTQYYEDTKAQRREPCTLRESCSNGGEIAAKERKE